MHKYAEIMDLIASDPEKQEELKEIVCDIIEKMKRYCPEEFYSIIYKIHCVAYGAHFDKELAKKAVSKMKNVDGTIGEHWNMEQTDTIASQHGVDRKADFYYTINMLYSDFSKVLGNDNSTYIKLAKAYMLDPDADEGKVFNIWAGQKRSQISLNTD